MNPPSPHGNSGAETGTKYMIYAVARSEVMLRRLASVVDLDGDRARTRRNARMMIRGKELKIRMYCRSLVVVLVESVVRRVSCSRAGFS